MQKVRVLGEFLITIFATLPDFKYELFHVSIQDVSKKNERSPVNEVHLVIMRLLSVFMSRTKSGSKPSSEVPNNSGFLYQI